MAESNTQDLASRAFELSLICENILINPRHHSSIVNFQEKKSITGTFACQYYGFCYCRTRLFVLCHILKESTRNHKFKYEVVHVIN